MTRASKHRRQREARRDLAIEALESRQMLTAAPGTATLENGILTVCGTDANNRIIVADLPNNYFVAADFLASNQLFPKSGVNAIRVSGGAGNDTLVASSLQMRVTLQGEAGDDLIFGGQANDQIEGGDGNDLIFALGGADLILGGNGLDRVFAGDGDDIVNGGNDNDILQGNAGDDLVNGESGDDILYGSAGADRVNGGVGNDRLLGGAGNDHLRGNAGNDVLVGEGDVDELFGDDGDDQLLGSGGNDVLVGGNGADRLVGGDGEDFLEGSSDDDVLFGDSAADLIIGGPGNDTVYGGTGPDMILGYDGDDILNGGLGFDVIVGHAGNDSLFGGNDRDILIGSAGADSLFGQGADDLLIGGITNNQLDFDALNAMRTSWTTAVSFGDRLAATLDGLVVEPEAPLNRLNGGSGQDAFYPVAMSEIDDQLTFEPAIGLELLALNETYEAAIGETISISAANGVLANDQVPGGGSLFVKLITPPQKGTLTLNADGSLEFTQTTLGRDSFVYEIMNGMGETSRATVRIVVPGLPPLPDGADLTTNPSGLQVYDFEVGTGAMPTASNTVRVGYVGYLPNGQIFDSNTMVNFPLGNLIQGFTEGVVGMKVGGMRRIVIPPDLGYGSNGNPGAGIGGTDIITFDVTLIDIIS